MTTKAAPTASRSWTARTALLRRCSRHGGGLHYVFAHPGPPVKNKVDTLGAGLDIRGNGGYIIAPPSLHKSGKRYTWEVVHEPDDAAGPAPRLGAAAVSGADTPHGPDAGAPIPDHQRNDTLFRLGCSFRAKGCTEAVILAALREMNTTQCQPPLRDDEVQKIVGSIAKYEPGARWEELEARRNGSTPGCEPEPPAWTTGLNTSKMAKPKRPSTTSHLPWNTWPRGARTAGMTSYGTVGMVGTARLDEAQTWAARH